MDSHIRDHFEKLRDVLNEFVNIAEQAAVAITDFINTYPEDDLNADEDSYWDDNSWN